MSEIDRTNESNSGEPERKVLKKEHVEVDENELTGQSQEAAGLELNEDCSDLNVENNNEGVLVSTIEDEAGLNEFQEESENAETQEEEANPTSKTTDNTYDNSSNNNNEADHLDDNSLQVDVPHDESGLYDDVMNGPNISASEFNSDLIAPNSNESHSGVKTEQANKEKLNDTTNSSKSQGYVKRVSCYVGNLTWWTSDKDLTEAVTSLGITDLLEIKFYENKINGQSKGFAMVTCGSDQSFRTLIDRLAKKEIHSQFPIVTPFSRHYFNQFEEQARRDMPSSSNNGSGGGNNNNGSDHQYQGHTRTNNEHHSSNSSHNHHHNNSSHHHNNSHQSGPNQFQNNQIMNRSNRFPSSNNNANPNMPAGLLGQGPRPNMSMNGPNGLIQQRPGLVGSYQQRNMNNNMNGLMGNQQSIMGMNNPNGSMRPNFNGSNTFNNNNQRNAPGSNPHQQTSLMGNRPPIASNGLLPMRPSLNPALVGNNGPIGQGVGLLNNPRLPINNNQSNMPGMPGRPNWENQNAGQMNNQFNNNLPNQQSNGNAMMPMNQNQNNMRMGQGPNQYPFSGNNNPGMSGPSPQNGILPNPPHPFQGNQQQPNQPNFQHPHSNQPGFNPQLNQSQQQPIINQQMNPQQNQHMLNNGTNGPMGTVAPGSQQHLSQMNQPGAMPHHHPQDPYYHRDSQVTSPGMHQHPNAMGHHSQLQMSQHKLSDIEFQEAFEKNRIVSSSAITRAVQDASIGQYPSAIETLITAISLIKQSKIANDERCKLFIISLQDTKKGIEDKYYGSGRSMSGGSMDGGVMMMSSGHGRGESRDRERLKRSRSRDSRDRRDRGEGREERDRDRDRDRSERSDRERSRRSEKHHRSHRERSSRDRSRDRRVVTSNSIDNMQQGDYYVDPMQQSSRYHRSRH